MGMRTLSLVRAMLVATALTALAELSAAQPTLPLDLRRPVPDAVADAAETPGVLAMVHGLAYPRIPAEAVVAAKGFEWVHGAISGQKPDGARSLGDAIDRFRQTHAEQVLSESGGYVTVFPRRSVCLPALGARITFRARGSLVEVFSQLAHRANPANPDVPTGIIPPGLGGNPPTLGLFSTPVEIDVTDAPLRTAFERLVRQAPGVAWVLGEMDEKGVGDVTCTLLF